MLIGSRMAAAPHPEGEQNQPTTGPVDQRAMEIPGLKILSPPLIKRKCWFFLDGANRINACITFLPVAVIDCTWARTKGKTGGTQTPRYPHFHVKCHAWRSLSCLFALLHFMATLCSLKGRSAYLENPQHIWGLYICAHLLQFWPSLVRNSL